MVTKRLFYPILLGLLLTAQLIADENQVRSLREICEVVTYQPVALNGLGMVLDLASIDSADSIPLADKRRIIRSVQQSDAESVLEELPKSVQNSSYLRLVNVQVDLSKTAALPQTVVDCRVTSLSGKPINGGYLLPTQMMTADPSDSEVYGIARGVVAATETANSGSISGGCRILKSLTRVISRNGKVVLFVDDAHSGVGQAVDIVEMIRGKYPREPTAVAVPLDERHIQIAVPKHYVNAQVEFVAEVMGLRV